MGNCLRISVALACLWMATSEAAVVRATEMKGGDWQKLGKGGEELVVEFRRGDEIPVSLSAEGDFLETTHATPSYVGVKKDFWLKWKDNAVWASLDGQTFRPLKDVASGELSLGAGSDESRGPVNGIQVLLSAKMK